MGIYGICNQLSMIRFCVLKWGRVSNPKKCCKFAILLGKMLPLLESGLFLKPAGIVNRFPHVFHGTKILKTLQGTTLGSSKEYMMSLTKKMMRPTRIQKDHRIWWCL